MSKLRMISMGLPLCLLGLFLISTNAAARKPAASNKLIETIGRRKYDDFTTELSTEGTDPNQPDSKGRLPLMEAVRVKDIRFVDALIQFGAVANSKDPATGASPLQLAFQTSQDEVARLLLAYGADINAVDKSGKKAREFQANLAVRDVIVQFDSKGGAMAFEDAPGTWVRNKNDKDQVFWFNVKTQEARWNMPPSCAWQRVQYLGQPNKYINYVTSQSVVDRPTALCWRLVNHQEQELWYNWAANITQTTAPDELPADLLEEAKDMKNVRWFNPRTKEFSWEDPKYHTSWRVIHEDGAEKPYYFNVQTGDSTWEPPVDLAWQQMEAPDAGSKYWYNARTGESTWDGPEHKAWERHDTDL